MLLKWYVALAARALRADRGEGPVPFIIIVAIMSLAAFTVAMFVSGVAERWMGQVQDVP
jgi:hypothetical protein